MTLRAILGCVAVVLFWGLSPIFEKRALAHVDAHQLFLARFYLTFVFLLAPMVFYFDEVRVAVWRADRRLLWMLAGAAAMPLLGSVIYYKALGAAEASKVVPFCAGYPVVTLLFACSLLGEPVTLSKMAGTAMVVGGAWLLARP